MGESRARAPPTRHAKSARRARPRTFSMSRLSTIWMKSWLMFFDCETRAREWGDGAERV
jgi:hypothetical protein